MDRKIAQAIYGSFKRLGNFPIDPSSYFETWDDLDDYLKNDRTIYPGQLLVVYNDLNDKNGLYITFEGADGLFKVSRVSQSEELNNKISELLNALDALKVDINGKIDIQNELIGSIQKDYATKEELKSEINALLGFEFPSNLDEVLNTFKEIDDWVKRHEEELEEYKKELDATHDLIDKKIEEIGSIYQKDIDDLKDKSSSLESRIDSLETGIIKNFLQTISLEIDSEQSESFSFNKLIPSGYVIQSVRVVTANDTSNPEDYDDFSVYLALDGAKYKELVEGKSFYPDIDNEPTINVSFKNLGESYVFDTDYEIPFIGVNTYGVEDTKVFELKVDISSSARCRGKVYVNYFKKV